MSEVYFHTINPIFQDTKFCKSNLFLERINIEHSKTWLYVLKVFVPPKAVNEFISFLLDKMLRLLIGNTPKPVYNIIVGVHIINRVS